MNMLPKTAGAAALVLGMAGVLAMAPAEAAPLKIGMITTYSGPFADDGHQMDMGMAVYMKEHGDTAGGRKIEIIRRDDTGPAPNVVKRLARELVVNDKVDVLSGFIFTPNAMVAAPVATQSKTPLVDMNAATTSLVTKSPYLVRTSFTLQQLTAPLARWAAANGIKSVYTAVSDYAPGYDAEKAFVSAFTAAGGKIVGKVRIPLKNTDFSPYVQRIKDVKPDAVFLFMPTGEPPIAFIRSYNDLGLPKAGIRLLGDGGASDDKVIQVLGKQAVGSITSTNYWVDLDNPVNKKFVADFHKLYGDKVDPDYFAVDAYDGMAAIYAAAAKVKDMHSLDAVAAMKGVAFDSPRGPVEIDPKTNDVVQNVYIRRAEMVDGHIKSVLIDTAERIDHNGDPVGK